MALSSKPFMGVLFVGLLCLMLTPQAFTHKITDSGSLFEVDPRGKLGNDK